MGGELHLEIEIYFSLAVFIEFFLTMYLTMCLINSTVSIKINVSKKIKISSNQFETFLSGEDLKQYNNANTVS